MAEPDHFERLALPRRFALVAAELERNYLAKSREVHPDLAGEASQAASARLNEAYAVLKDPARRADYLLTLLGGPSATEVKQPPPEFLEEMLDLRMEVEGARRDPAARVVLEESLTARRMAMLTEIGAGLDGETINRGYLRQRLNALKYISGMIRDLSED